MSLPRSPSQSQVQARSGTELAVLTGDIVRSSKLSPEALDAAMEALARGAAAMAAWEGGRDAAFTRFRGDIGIENARTDIGSTLNPALRFYVFDAAPNPDRLLPATPGTPLPRPEPLTTVDAAVDRVFRHALGRAPKPAERSLAESALGWRASRTLDDICADAWRWQEANPSGYDGPVD